jgi:hypothetical protein
VSARRLFLLFKVGITGLLSASVFGLVIVRDGGLLFCRITRGWLHTRSYCMARGGFLLSFIISVFGFIISCSISLFVVSKN